MRPVDVIGVARSVIGTPFLHQGRSLRGMDCVGLLIHVAEQFGAPYIDVAGYGRRPTAETLEQAFDANVESGNLIRVALGSQQIGDFLMMRFTRHPQHLAIFAGENIIHSYEAVGKVCEHRLDALWASRVVRVYRLAGMSNE